MGDRIEDVIIKTLISIEAQVITACDMHVPYPKNLFELFGFDIMIDSQLKPWLLEVNFSPSLACDSDLDLEIKAGVIADSLTLMGVKVSCPNPSTKVKTLGKGRGKSKVNAATHKGDNAAKSKALLESAIGSNICAALEMNDDEMRVVREFEAEQRRAGRFRRIMPGRSAFQYKRFFEEERPLNTLLANY